MSFSRFFKTNLPNLGLRVEIIYLRFMNHVMLDFYTYQIKDA